MVGNNTPVFFIRDPSKFPGMYGLTPFGFDFAYRWEMGLN